VNDTEDRIRAATKAAARIVREVRPLDARPGPLDARLGPLDARPGPLDVRPDPLAAPAPGRRSPGSRSPGRRTPRFRSWAAPLTAAAAVLLIAVALVAVRDLPSGRSGAPARTVPSSSGAAGLAGVPKVYVALNNAQIAASPDQIVVGDTLTGSRLATVNPPAHGTFGGVTGAADDRTFILDVRQFPWSNTYMQVTPRTFELLRVGAGPADPVRVTKLRIPATPNGAQVNGIALSPDGTEFAVMFQPQAWGPAPGGMTLQVYSVATGKLLRAWAGPAPDPHSTGVQTFGEALYLDPNTTLSWTANGRSLAFVYGPELITDTTVRLLDLTSPGHDLLADSRPVLDLTSGRAPNCTSLLLTSDGRTVACGAMLASAARSTGGCSAAAGLARPGIDEYSIATGKLASVIYRYAGPCVVGRADVLWASPTGTTVLGYLGVTQQGTGRSTIRKQQTGVFAGGKFRPLTFGLAGGPPSAGTIAF
jgi:hypothetical protein